jgi:hypothetical protein
VLDWSKKRLSSKHSEVGVQVLQDALNLGPVARRIDIASISHRLLIAIGTGEIAGDTNGKILYGHGPT